MSLTPSLVAGLADLLGERLALDAPLGALTTYRVGGRAAALVTLQDEQELLALGQLLGDAPVAVLGRGSNTLVADAGFPGVVVVLGEGFTTITLEGTPVGSVLAGARVDLPVLARSCVEGGLGGLEWAVGVPGSVGGAVVMNAGGHGSDIAASLVSARVVDLNTGTARDLDLDALGFGYRRSSLRASDVVVSARFVGTPIEPEQGREAMREVVRWRREHQPGGQNAGSVFTNPEGDSAGRLIDAVGLRGRRVGSAEVSTKHANFIQADRGGSADDVAALMALVRAEVLAGHGVALVPETRLLGFSAGQLEAMGR